FYFVHFMDRAVIQKDHLPSFQRRSQQFFDKEKHGLSIHRARHAQPPTDAIKINGADGRNVFPMVARNLFDDPLPRLSAAIKPGHRKMTANFVNEDKLAGVNSSGYLPELVAFLFVPLMSDETFFYAADQVVVERGKWWADLL